MPVEGRGGQVTEPKEGKMKETLSSDNVSTRLQRIADLARKAPGMAMTTLSHHIDIELLHEAFRRTRKDGAAGVDHQVAADYAVGLEERLESLLVRFKTGSYFAPPVRRVHIPKGDGHSTRPIGIPTIEDKVLQRAVLMVLEAIYEQDFLPCSYGFRPGRSAHDALEATWQATMKARGGWVLEADIKGCLRHSGPWSSTGLSRPAGARRCGASHDRQVAQSGCAGGRPCKAVGGGYTAGRGAIAVARERLPARGLG